MNDELVFVDSNVWLYLFLPHQDQEKVDTAAHLLKQYGNRIVVSTQVINETARNIKRKNVMSEARLRDLIDSFYDMYQVVEMSRAIQIEASRLREKYALSFWDSHIVVAALQTPATTLLSEDMHHTLQVEERLTILNPFAD